jgi:regulator of replication initiation timing
MAKARAVDLEPIDRLGEKIKVLVAALDQLRADQSRVIEDNQRLSRELEMARTRLAEAEAATSEALALKEEREQIRTRVAEMLEQIEALNL